MEKPFGTAEEKPLDFISVADARKYLEEGQFEAGTMAPKIEAAVSYIGDSAIRKKCEKSGDIRVRAIPLSLISLAK